MTGAIGTGTAGGTRTIGPGTADVTGTAGMAGTAGVTGGRAEVGGVVLPYDVHGEDGRPRLVLACGQGMTRAMWQLTVVPALVEAGLQVLCYDQRGAGDASAPPGPYSVPRLAEDLLALLRRLGWDRTGLAGVSLGGMVGECLAAPRPDVVTRAALIASTSVPTAFQRAYAEARSSSRSDAVNRLLELLTTVSAENLRDDTPMARTGLSFITRRGGHPDGFHDQGGAGDEWLVRADRHALWDKIDVPCLLMAFEHDLLLPPEAVRQAAGLIRDARFEMIRDVAHANALIKATDEIGEILADFFLG
ncbi:alpha/beta fold hydrolase [Streptosporangium sandarakinum]